jgi:DtxR family transcriptional regulator, Mn-dependent transcriptional regulator
MPRSASHCLADLPSGASTVIRRVSDADPELLRYLASRAIVPGRQVRVIDRSPFDHNISLRVIGKAGTVVLGPEITRHIFVDQGA